MHANNHHGHLKGPPGGTWSSSLEPSASHSKSASTGTTTATTTIPQSPPGSSSSLKRSRSVANTQGSMARPLKDIKLPGLSGDITLEVYTHRSLRFTGTPQELSEYGDNDRLALMGERAMDTAVTDALFRKKPMLNATEIENQRAEILSHKSVEQWADHFKMMDKLRCTFDVIQGMQESREKRAKEAHHLFCLYVGALYAESGMQKVQNWIGELVDPEYNIPPSSKDADMDTYTPKRFKSEQPIMTVPEPFFAAPPPPPPAAPPPPLPMVGMTVNPLAPAQPQAAFLPLFNQTATQRRLTVEYPAVFTGPPHAGKWTVRCVVNGIDKGNGAGASKQLAKEEAAKQAYYAMGWAPRG